MKRKPVKKILSVLLTGALVLSMPLSAMAEDTSVDLGSKTVGRDLFASNTKGMMPGDSAAFSVGLTNVTGKRVEVYFRAVDTAESKITAENGSKAMSDQLLSVLELTITKPDNTVVYQGTADGKSVVGGTALNPIESEEPSANILLGTLEAEGQTYLNVTINVDKNLGNEYQKALAMIDWEFGWKDVTPIDPPPGPGPDPGDPDDPYIPPSDPDDPYTPPSDPDDVIDIPEEETPLAPPVLDIPDAEVPLAPPDQDILVDIPDGELPLTGAIAAMAGNTQAVGSVVVLLLAGCVGLTVWNRRKQ